MIQSPGSVQSDCESACDLPTASVKSFDCELRAWIIRYNVTYCGVNELLSILKHE